MESATPTLEYCGLRRVDGPLFVIDGIRGVGYAEIVEIVAPDGGRRLG